MYDIKFFDADKQKWQWWGTSNEFQKAWDTATQLKKRDESVHWEIVKRGTKQKYYI